MDDEIFREYRRLLEALALLERVADLAWPTLAEGLRGDDPRAAAAGFCREVKDLLAAVAAGPRAGEPEAAGKLRSALSAVAAKLRRADPSAPDEVPVMLFVLWSEMVERLRIDERLAKRAEALRGRDRKAVFKRVVKDCCAESGTEAITPHLRRVWQAVRDVSLEVLPPETLPTWRDIVRKRYDMSRKERCTGEHFRQVADYGRRHRPLDRDFPRKEETVAQVFRMCCSCCRGAGGPETDGSVESSA